MICKIGCGLRPVASATGRVGYATRVQEVTQCSASLMRGWLK